MKKILIIQTAFIGDVILATGILEKLHSHFPDTDLHFLLRKGNESILQGHPFLTKVWIWNKKENKQKNLFRLIREIRKERFDLVINLQRFASSGLLTVFSGAQRKIGFKKNPLSFIFSESYHHQIGEESHEIDRNNKLIEKLTDGNAFKPKLYPTKSDFNKIQPYSKAKFVTIAPASVWFTKAAPIEKWAELIDDIPSDYSIYLLGSEQDIILCDELKRTSDRSNIDILAGKLSLLESGALMSKANMNYSNDSAPLHLASAMNAPATGIFCSTIPGFGFGPLSEKSFIMQTQEYLACRPCGLHGKRKCPENHFKCGYTIKMRHYG